MRTHRRLASVTADGIFAYVQFGCGHVQISREDNKIILTAGPTCKLDQKYDVIEINVAADHTSVEPEPISTP